MNVKQPTLSQNYKMKSQNEEMEIQNCKRVSQNHAEFMR